MLRALTLRQPFAGLVAAGLKLVENRGFAPSWRGPFAIHSAKAVDWPEMQHQITAGVVAPFTVLGAVLAVADLVDRHEADQDSTVPCCAPFGLRTWNDKPAQHLILANIRQLEQPVECRGQLGFWPLPADVEQAVRAQLSPPAPEEAK
jgi:hypothetical protein